MATSRLIRASFIDSERIAQLDWRAECFFHRLLLVADDHGLFDARSAYLRAVLYPLQFDKMSDRDIQGCLAMCEAVGLIKVYSVEGKPYLQILRYGQRAQSKPKFPLPPTENHENPPKSTVIHSDSPKSTAKTETNTETNTETKTETYPNSETETKTINGVVPFPSDFSPVLTFMRSLLERPQSDSELTKCAKSFFDEMEASGWLNRNGLPMANWQAKARKYARSWAINSLNFNNKQNPARQNLNAGGRYS